jgi:Tfp pilus assembly protein PilO
MSKNNSLDNSFNYKLIFAIAFLLTALAITFLILWPKTEELKIKRLEVREKLNEFETKEEYLSSISQAYDQLKNYQTQVDQVNQALPDNPSLPSVFNYIQKTASESGLILVKLGKFKTTNVPQTVVSGQETTVLAGVKETDFDIELAGSYSAFKSFLARLEKSARLIKIENLSFVSEKESFIFNLRLKVYSY